MQYICNCCIVFKIEFKTSLKFYFVSYNTKNNILSLKILFVGYNKEFCQKSNLDRHINKKFKCISKDEIISNNFSLHSIDTRFAPDLHHGRESILNYIKIDIV